MPRARNKKYQTRLNPFTGKRERVTRNPLGTIRINPMRKRPNTVGGLRKRRTTPGAPLPFSYGWESVYKRGK